MVYRPSLLVTTARDFSISASLAASTLTPDITAPVESFTTPEIVLWAEASDGNTASTTRPAKIFALNLTLIMAFSPLEGKFNPSCIMRVQAEYSHSGPVKQKCDPCPQQARTITQITAGHRSEEHTSE